MPENTKEVAPVRKTILYLEDNHSFRTVAICSHLQNYDVICCDTVDQAIAEIEQPSASIDLILCDHDLPGDKDGSELIKYCRRNGIDTPIIGFSAIEVNNEHLLNVGADFALSKRQQEHLPSVLNRFLDEHTPTNLH